MDALVHSLAEHPVADHDAALRYPELADLLRRDQQHLRDALAEPDVALIVTPVEADAHFVRDQDGVVEPDSAEITTRPLHDEHGRRGEGPGANPRRTARGGRRAGGRVELARGRDQPAPARKATDDEL